MCGIVGYIGPKTVVPVILDGLRKLEYRGYDSAGIAVVRNGKVAVRRSSGKLVNLARVAESSPLEGEYGIGHTRWATHGRPTEENAHPHRDCTGNIVVVHNGIIENYLDLKSELQGQGHRLRDRDRHRGHCPSGGIAAARSVTSREGGGSGPDRAARQFCHLHSLRRWTRNDHRRAQRPPADSGLGRGRIAGRLRCACPS